MKGKITSLGILLSSAFSLAPVAALAQTAFPSAPLSAPEGIGDVSTFTLFVDVLINWIFWGLIVLAIVMVLIAGYRYAISSGNPEKTKTANRALLYAAIAVAVGIIAKGLPLLIASFFGAYF